MKIFEITYRNNKTNKVTTLQAKCKSMEIMQRESDASLAMWKNSAPHLEVLSIVECK